MSGGRIADHRSTDWLGVGTVVYLALPNLIFDFGWLQLPLALVLATAVIYLIFSLPAGRCPHPGQNSMGLILIGLVGLTWAAFSGGSHFLHADHDWIVRDAVLGDLVRQDWPVLYPSGGGEFGILRSAVGFFLPAALVGKAFGLAKLSIAVFAWTALGCILFLMLLPLPTKSSMRLSLALLVIIAFSGMDFLGGLIATQSLPIFPLRLEWWVPLSYPSLTGHLTWAPNHCLPAWLGTALLIRHRHNPDQLAGWMIVTLPLTLIWSPFAIVGLLPIAVALCWRSLLTLAFWQARYRAILAAILVALAVAAFLLIGATQTVELSTTLIARGSGMAQQATAARDITLFILMEFGLLGLCLAGAMDKDRPLFIAAMAILLALPLLHLGPSNDLLIRSSAPALVVLMVCTLSCLGLLADKQNVVPQQPGRKLIIGAVLSLGAVTPAHEFARALQRPAQAPSYDRTLISTQGGQLPSHYVGNFPKTLGPLLFRRSQAVRP